MPGVIVGTGHFLPPRVVTNEELAPKLGVTSQWIEERTGIRARRFIEPGDSNSNLATQAALNALNAANLKPTDLDAIVVATLSPDMAFPGTSVYLQRNLECGLIPAIDIRAQCSGFLYALSVANAWIDSGVYERILVVGSEVHSTGLDFSERGRSISILFGDGAGAVILEKSTDSARGIVEISLGADGSGAELLCCEGQSSSRHPNISHEALDQGRQFPHMEGKTVFRKAVEKLDVELKQLFERHRIGHSGEHSGSAYTISLDELIFVPHQSNKRINDLLAARLKLEEKQIVHTISECGNTTAGSIPISLDIAYRDGRILPGKPIVLAAFGSGLTWGTALIRA